MKRSFFDATIWMEYLNNECILTEVGHRMSRTTQLSAIKQYKPSSGGLHTTYLTVVILQYI